VKKNSSKFPGAKKCINLVDPLGGGGVSRKVKILSLDLTLLKYLIAYGCNSKDEEKTQVELTVVE
jgi:hypothetical protein